MIRKYNTVLLVLAVTLICAGTALAEKLEDMPGYVDLEWITIPDDADEIQDIDLGPVLLSIAADKEDEALMKALSMIKSIRVRAFSISEASNADVEAAVAKVEARLKQEDWKRLIYVKDSDETVTVSTKYVDSDMVGMMLVTFEPGDSAAFINVVGDLDLGTLFKLAQEMDSDSIEDMLDDLEDIEGIEVNSDN